jgi:cyclophilin family peptidyl-prolyl cis-trans isomerase
MARTVEPMLEALESRCLLSVPDSTPDISLLDDATNPVVRLETDLGRIDIEVLINEAPLAGGNFLQMLRTGAADLSFFHSLDTGETLSGGLFKLVGGEPTSLSQEFDVETTTPRPNTERTLAAPLLGGGLDMTDGRWVINLSDSPLRDSQFIVFARVIGGWDVVQSIAGLMAEDYSGEAAALTSVPVLSTGAPLSEAVTVDIIDADQIKPQGLEEYWTQSVVYPEGFAGPEKREVLSIASTTAFDIRYEVTIRYEVGMRRDVIVATGTLAANDRLDLVLSDPDDMAADLVASGVPYAVEVRAVGDPGVGAEAPPAEVVSASVDRTEGFFRFEDPLTPDAGEPSAAENLFNLAGYSAAQLRSWVLGPVEGVDSFTLSDGTLRVITRQSFATWMNLAAEAATVTVTFLGGGDPLSMVFALDPLRRGGAALHEELFEREGITTFFEGVLITSTQPIAVQFSGYAQILDDPTAGANQQYRSAFSALAAPGGGSATGVMPTIGETVYINPGTTAVDISVEVINGDGLIDVFELNDVQPGELAFGPELTDLAIDAQAIRFTSTGPVGAFLFGEGDGFNAITPFQQNLGNALHFARGAPDAISEDWQLGVYRPTADDPATRFRVRFTFDDGTEFNTSILNFNEAGFRSLRLDDTELLPVRARLLGGDASFSIDVFSVDSGGTARQGSPLGAILLSVTADADDAWAMIGMPTGPIEPWEPGLGG